MAERRTPTVEDKVLVKAMERKLGIRVQECIVGAYILPCNN